MIREEDLEDIVIKSYLEVYLNALNDEKPEKFINQIHNRLSELLSRKRIRKSLSEVLI